MMPEIGKNFDKQPPDILYFHFMTTRLQQLNHWLSAAMSTKDYHLEPASSDASFRCYFRLSHANETFIVMDAPPKHEDCASFIDIAQRLLAVNINAPQIIKKDLQQGFLLLSDLGNKQYLDVLTEDNVDDLYSDAMGALFQIQRQADSKGLPAYNEALLLREMELFRHYLLQEHIGLDLTAQIQTMLNQVFKFLVKESLSQPRVFVHRDYHSRNLIIDSTGNRTGDERPGILDFQDAVIGPVTYDLVSLLKDCYIKWPRQKIRSWANVYFEKIADDYADIEATKFMRWFDLAGVQRHLKTSGIFARLCHRDGKTGYLADIPRTLSYIVDLEDEYPELHDLIELIQNQVVPVIAKANKSCVL